MTIRWMQIGKGTWYLLFSDADELPLDLLNEYRVNLSSNAFVWSRFGSTITKDYEDERDAADAR